ncbi:TetR/AcrR family transcriptional regulator [Chryseobacterium indologenes]|uniref:TetR/AcrR family transcriptional regulator n=1 Tax=Chryseobacterium TaxID=59732 RepID=UPI001625B7D0|nr:MULTISPECIES: TetR/AcrR family transcriptional regulator [Chryseobacterium]MDM1556775.1 TetR/AcrR family transcriptional regulator [Chryseobacterium indologenes]WET51670.1 TetR/AcrR family transcriptional regulator [Chryseobacterium indologenes]
MSTKDKILAKALELFNEKGYNNITTRHIAAELSISPGNLHYHFKHSEDIIKILFAELTMKMDELLNKMKTKENKTLEDLYILTSSTCEIFYHYRFIFVNLVDVLKKLPEVEAMYERINFSRREEFQLIFSGLQKNKIFKKDIPGFIINSLTEQIFIIADNWLTHNRLISKLNKKAAIKSYTLLLMNLFYPFLSKEQQKIYEQQYL